MNRETFTPKDDGDLRSKVAAVESNLEVVTRDIGNLVKHIEARDKAQAERDAILFKKIEESNERSAEAINRANERFSQAIDKAREAQRPNIQTWFAGLGLVVVVVFGVYTPFADGLNEKVKNALVETQLADKAQQELIQRNHDELQAVKDFQLDRIKSDLEELRQWRMKGKGVPQ
jgi:hypothetical protein